MFDYDGENPVITAETCSTCKHCAFIQKESKCCMGEPERVHHFGPVNVAVTEGVLRCEDPSTRACGSAWITLIYLLMGANLMLILVYTYFMHMHFTHIIHVFLCSLGFQIFVPIGILVQSSMHGPSQFIFPEDRLVQHKVLQVMGVLFGSAGAVAILWFSDTRIEFWGMSVHCILGIGATLASLIVAVSAYSSGDENLYNHPMLGITAYITTSMCFISGILRAEFGKVIPQKLWADIVYLAVVFCVVITVVVVYFPCKHYSRRTRKEAFDV